MKQRPVMLALAPQCATVEEPAGANHESQADGNGVKGASAKIGVMTVDGLDWQKQSQRSATQRNKTKRATSNQQAPHPWHLQTCCALRRMQSVFWTPFIPWKMDKASRNPSISILESNLFAPSLGGLHLLAIHGFKDHSKNPRTPEGYPPESSFRHR
jgi:hypothetical protein